MTRKVSKDICHKDIYTREKLEELFFEKNRFRLEKTQRGIRIYSNSAGVSSVISIDDLGAYIGTSHLVEPGSCNGENDCWSKPEVQYYLLGNIEISGDITINP